MHKKLMMACMAIAAFAAFVVAPAASASPVLTKGGVTVANGTTFTITNTGETVFTGAFNVRCTNADLSGTVTSNTGTKIKGTIPVGSAVFTGTGIKGDCTSALGDTRVTINSELCVESVGGLDIALLTGCGGNVTFTLEVTGSGPCKYSTASVNGSFNTNADAILNLSEQEAKKSEGGIFCPASGKLDMFFDMTVGGSTLSIS